MSRPYSGKAGLASLINKANGTGYTADTLGHEAPAAYTGPNGENTKVLVWHTSKPDKKEEVYYKRLDLADVLVDLEGGYESADLAALLTALNAERLLDITADDLEDVESVPDEGDVVLTAKATSLGYIGTATVTNGPAAGQRVAPQSFSEPEPPTDQGTDAPTGDAPEGAVSGDDAGGDDEEITEENTRPD